MTWPSSTAEEPRAAVGDRYTESSQLETGVAPVPSFFTVNVTLRFCPTVAADGLVLPIETGVKFVAVATALKTAAVELTPAWK